MTALPKKNLSMPYDIVIVIILVSLMLSACGLKTVPRPLEGRADDADAIIPLDIKLENSEPKTLILIDIQNDFCPGGALAVPEGDAVVPAANRLMPVYSHVIATQDWHPAGHHSFASGHGKKPGDIVMLGNIRQILWPDHCVQGTHGAEFHPALHRQYFTHIVQKGINPEVDSYSAFFDNARLKSTGLADYLHRKGITHLDIMGLATDYCVKYSALDALDLGFQVRILLNGCRGINLQPGDTDRALSEITSAGGLIVNE
ncbi:hypothetical protein CHS0354_018365 [Potamilus streckersoni]|uniref:nicotinamidase n=1 Tax=Potamilus streckersoni TaxID=2493646 RepID=A0AAE0TAI2_9BIVA|nr:hypothetical protein CHS0354_018365 [Potamilus streckersoni]